MRRSAPTFRAVADGEPVVDHRYGAVGDEALDPRPIDDRDQGRGRATGTGGQIDRKIAHDPLDNVGAKTIFPGEHISL